MSASISFATYRQQEDIHTSNGAGKEQKNRRKFDRHDWLNVYFEIDVWVFPN